MVFIGNMIEYRMVRMAVLDTHIYTSIFSYLHNLGCEITCVAHKSFISNDCLSACLFIYEEIANGVQPTYDKVSINRFRDGVAGNIRFEAAHDSKLRELFVFDAFPEFNIGLISLSKSFMMAMSLFIPL